MELDRGFTARPIHYHTSFTLSIARRPLVGSFRNATPGPLGSSSGRHLRPRDKQNRDAAALGLRRPLSLHAVACHDCLCKLIRYIIRTASTSLVSSILSRGPNPPFVRGSRVAHTQRGEFKFLKRPLLDALPVGLDLRKQRAG